MIGMAPASNVGGGSTSQTNAVGGGGTGAGVGAGAGVGVGEGDGGGPPAGGGTAARAAAGDQASPGADHRDREQQGSAFHLDLPPRRCSLRLIGEMESQDRT